MVVQNWEKTQAKGKRRQPYGACRRSRCITGTHQGTPDVWDKARSVGFDWEHRDQVWEKVKEEIDEFQAEINRMDKDKMEDEFGDVMFSLINAARLYDINPEKCTGTYQS